jgi:hypothetical protein
MSYEVRVVDPAGSVAPVGRASWSENAGMATTPSSPITATTAINGFLMTIVTQRSPRAFLVELAGGLARR